MGNLIIIAGGPGELSGKPVEILRQQGHKILNVDLERRQSLRRLSGQRGPG